MKLRILQYWFIFRAAYLLVFVNYIKSFIVDTPYPHMYFSSQMRNCGWRNKRIIYIHDNSMLARLLVVRLPPPLQHFNFLMVKHPLDQSADNHSPDWPGTNLPMIMNCLDQGCTTRESHAGICIRPAKAFVKFMLYALCSHILQNLVPSSTPCTKVNVALRPVEVAHPGLDHSIV